MAVVWFRLVITGGDHHRLHEELTLAGGFLRFERFTREPRVTVLRRLVREARPLDSTENDGLLAALAERFHRFESSLVAAMEARSRDRLKYLGNTLERRKEMEIQDVRSTFEELRRAIEEELREHRGPVQLELWPEEEKRQYRRDLEGLRRRLERIPKEKEREVETVARRYADTRVHTFPACLVFLVPESMVGGSP